MKRSEGIAIVVGGGRGIGRAVVKTLVEKRGYEVIIADTNNLTSHYNQYRSQRAEGFDAAKDLEREILEAGGKATAVEVNACIPQSVQDLLEFRGFEKHRLEAVVNCFGITHLSTIEHMSLDEFNGIVQGNLQGVFLMSRATIPILRGNGGGSIVNFASISAKMGFPNVVHYCAAKAAIIGFTSALALEVASMGIRVNAVCPGIVRTTMWEYLLDQLTESGEDREECWRRMLDMIPQRAAQSAEEVSELVAHLVCSPGITGQALSIDGGMNKVPWA